MRNTQDKVLAMMEALAEEHDMELIVDRKFANTGYATFQDPHSLEAHVEVYFKFQPRWANLSATFAPGTPVENDHHHKNILMASAGAPQGGHEKMQAVLDAVDRHLRDAY